MTTAALMDTERSASVELEIRTLSMQSIAGITVAMFGMPSREKNNVASLNI
jgi:hypothetical protein